MYDKLINRLREQADAARFYSGEKMLYDEAADAIEELQAQLIYSNDAAKAIAEKVPKWIPVTERLPEKDGLYLVWMLWPCDEFPTWSIINFDSVLEEFGEWQEFCDKDTLAIVDREFRRIRNVFAWMPLPEPPKEET